VLRSAAKELYTDTLKLRHPQTELQHYDEECWPEYAALSDYSQHSKGSVCTDDFSPWVPVYGFYNQQ
jgi:hypothetical protein